MENYKILVINPGSTSTKISIFENEKAVFSKNIFHPENEIHSFQRIVDQKDFRKAKIIETIKEAGYDEKSLSCVVGRGGLLMPIPSGTYIVNELMIEHLLKGIQGEHASNLGGLIAYEIAHPLNIPAYIVDPVVVDEMEEIAKISGHPLIKRRSIFHALNHKAVGRKIALKEFNKKYEELNLIIAHLGGGISVAAHRRGKVIDVNNALNGDGPFAPERAGGLPVWDSMKLALSGKYTENELKKMLAGKGGVVAYLQTNDMRKVEEMIKNQNKFAKLIVDAMAYQVSKEIGALSTVLEGNMDAIVLTGGLAYFKYFTEQIERRVKHLGKIIISPGEDEMEALAFGALRVLKSIENAKEYKEDLWNQ